MKRVWGDRTGFTLVEILIVVIILGILAAVAIPQFTGSTDEARDVSLKANLTQMRNAIELYYHQHNNTYPGVNDEATGLPAAAQVDAEAAFVAQLTGYTDATGKANSSKTSVFKYGPYMKVGVPTNPFNDKKTVAVDIVEADIADAASSTTHGFRFYRLTGRLIADDGAHDGY